MKVTFQGDPVEVSGSQPKIGDKAPNVTLKNRKDEAVELSSYFGKTPVVISVVPDVQTRTCELQTKRFSKELDEKEVSLLTVSRNTVEEFNEWNEENDLDLQTLSDSNKEFGEKYGLEIDLDGNKLLTRSVFLIDEEGTIQYVQIVDEVVDEPDYEETLKAIEKNK